MEPLTTENQEIVNSLMGHKPFRITAGPPSEHSGNAPSVYDIHWDAGGGYISTQRLKFQDGPIGEVGWNGIIDEALTAILIHRLECWQAGQYANRENALAKTALEESLLWRLKRTLDRELRGVEGTHKV